MRFFIGERARQQRLLCSVACAIAIASASTSQAGIGGSDLRVSMKGIGGSDLEVLGLVEASHSDLSVLIVSGQTVHLTTTTQLASVPEKGKLVAVYGPLNADGSITASQVTEVKQPYVAGATNLYVRGVVQSMQPAVARAQVGGLSVDYSAGLSTGNAADIQVGRIAEFAGLQTSSTTLYASHASTVKVTAAPQGIGGSDRIQVSGIGGSDRVAVSTAGIGGSDRVAVSTAGIGGSDRVAVSTAGIGGSDRVAVSTAGIGGSDRVAVSTAGIGGSDRVAVTTAGIGGSDRTVSRSAGIGGSD